jgi:predicted nucleotidyltransferase
MTIEELKAKNAIVFKCTSGSRAQGLATSESDEDINGVFVLPKERFFSLNYIPQVSNDTNDIVYYEIGRFIELLSKSNPTALELLYTPEDYVHYADPLFETIRKYNYLSKQCEASFGGYAMAQIKKAKGLKKKIVNPVDKERKGVLDFCYITNKQGSIPANKFLEMNDLSQDQCGLVKLTNMKDMYGLYYGEPSFRGIVNKDNANDVALSAVPKHMIPLAYMSFNKSGYSSYCKDYREYWNWVSNRNENRYRNTVEQAKNYDAKNMMHTFRLLNMCEEIAREHKLNVWRNDREYLLSIKNGKLEYKDLVREAENKLADIKTAYMKSDLPEKPDFDILNQLLIDFRLRYYSDKI